LPSSSVMAWKACRVRSCIRRWASIA
jgi:hypothetical protein